MPAGDVFGLDGFFLNKSNPIRVSSVEINSTASGAGIAVTSGVLNATAGIATLTFQRGAVGLSTTPFYVGAKIAVSGLANASGLAHTGYNGVFVVTGFAGTTTVSYATTGYVGSVTTGITTTGQVTLVTDTAVTNTTWSSAQTHGFFGGGNAFGIPTYSTVDRIDFSNDTGTVSVRGPLSLARTRGAASGNSNYGWFSGNNPPTSTIDRIDFSNDSSSSSSRGPLSLAKIDLGATGNSNYGWFGGGFSSSIPGNTSSVDRIDFSNDSGTALVRGPLSRTKADLAATGNSNYGWFGSAGTVDRIDFSNDFATSSSRSTLTPRTVLAATGNSNYGWWGGGYAPGYRTIVDRIDFSNDLPTALSRGPLTQARDYFSATGNSNYGWFGGGYSPDKSTIERIDFSNDSVAASVRGSLSLPKRGPSATSGQARSSSTRLQKGGNYGWFGGGTNFPSTIVYSTIDRIDFSNDTPSASSRSSLSIITKDCGATGNSNYGYWGGGETPANTSKVDRLNFSSDTGAVSVRGPMTGLTYYVSATGNSNYGYFGGGKIPSPARTSKVDRINFANDYSTASPRGVLTAAKYAMATASNSNYGWWGGGALTTPGLPGAITTVDRIDFSNDSVGALSRGPLSGVKYGGSGTGNSNYGWMSGGNWPSPGFVNVVERINYANDSVSVSVRGPLTSGRYMLAATGNSNYGWFGGGRIPTPAAVTNIVERINFSNDLAVTSPRGSLFTAREKLAATSNATR